MAVALVDTMSKLQLAAASDSNDDEWIDSILDHAPPRQRVAQDSEELKAELERKYLTPSTAFSEPWLNRLQQYVSTSIPNNCWSPASSANRRYSVPRWIHKR